MKTDQFSDHIRSRETSLSNLVLEASRLEKIYRDGDHSLPRLEGDHLKHVLSKSGDILWYLANFLRHSGSSIEKVARSNLEEISEKFGGKTFSGKSEPGFSQLEDLPDRLEVAFIQQGRYLVIATELSNGEYLQLGDRINDNSDTKDFYRYHDVFHLAYMAILGWSPVMRSLFKRKRKSQKKVDEIQDGARAGDLEEAITAFIFEDARKNDWYRSNRAIAFEVLETIGLLTAHLEVRSRTYEDWQRAILAGYSLFDKLKENGGGIIRVERSKRFIEFVAKESAPAAMKQLFELYDFKKRLSATSRKAQHAIDKAEKKIRSSRLSSKKVAA